jgi:hypothetical protein
MPNFVIAYVKYVDYASTKFGRLAMYSIFLMIGTLYQHPIVMDGRNGTIYHDGVLHRGRSLLHATG